MDTPYHTEQRMGQLPPFSFPIQYPQTDTRSSFIPDGLPGRHPQQSSYLPSPTSAPAGSPMADSSSWNDDFLPQKIHDVRQRISRTQPLYDEDYIEDRNYYLEQTGQVGRTTLHPYCHQNSQNIKSESPTQEMSGYLSYFHEQNGISALGSHPPSNYTMNSIKDEISQPPSLSAYDRYKPSSSAQALTFYDQPRQPSDQTFSNSLQQSTGCLHNGYRNLTPTSNSALDEDGYCGIFDQDSDGENVNEQPYAKLIYKALLSAPGHSMVLKQIYEWFELNTDKARVRSGSDKGWQNSIRHNLSMNGAFKKVEQTPSKDDSKKGYMWVLEESAKKEGVKSTTRYRKNGLHKRGGASLSLSSSKQRSGRWGVSTSKKARGRYKRSHDQTPQIDQSEADDTLPDGESVRSTTDITDSSAQASPYFASHTSHPQQSVIESNGANPFHYDGLMGVTPSFYEQPLFGEPNDSHDGMMTPGYGMGEPGEESLFSTNNF